jgi:hypothetical protein
VPEGREISLIGDTVLMDGPLPYDELPIYSLCPAEEWESGTGYSDAWDLMALSQAYDACISSMATTQDAWGIPNLLVTEGQDIQVDDVTSGPRIVKYKLDGNAPPPSAMQMPSIPESSARFADILRSELEMISGVNSVARGNPSDSLKSGTALALVQAQALQYASGYQRAYTTLLRKCANGLIKLLQRYAQAERVIEIAGRDKARMVKEFSSKDLKHVRGVRAELGNPLMRTVAGRREVATELLANFGPGSPSGYQITPEQYLAFQSTGRLEPMYEHQRSEVQLIRAENDRLSSGQPVKALGTDHHMLHIREHACVLHNPEVRYNDGLAGPVTQHIMEHMNLLMSIPPPLLEATGQQAPQMMPPPPDAGAGPPPEGGGDEEEGPQQATVPGVDPSQLEAPLPNMPQPPQ